MHVFPSLQAQLPATESEKFAQGGPKIKDDAETRIRAFAWQRDFLKTRRKQCFGPHVRSTACLRHPGKACPVVYQDPDCAKEGSRPLKVGIAGLPCQPFSRYGSHEPRSHMALEAVILGLEDLSHSGFDVWFFENSDVFPVELLEPHVPPNFILLYQVFGPQDICRAPTHTIYKTEPF